LSFVNNFIVSAVKALDKTESVLYRVGKRWLHIGGIIFPINNKKPATLWITREKLWIKPINWGESGGFAVFRLFAHPYIWGVLSGTPHRALLPVGWGNKDIFLPGYPGLPCGEKKRFYHPGMGG